MKNDFSAGSFFDLSGFEHRELFEVENIWEVLSKITGYIKSKTNENILIGEGSTVEEGAFIKGPAIIGKNTLIRHGAYVRENVIVGDNCIIGHSVEIKNSVILSGARIAHFNYIGDSIIGNDVNFAGGTITANFRLDGANVGIKHNGEIIETGLPKLGAIIGDGSKIGVNAVLNPGTILSKNTKVFPLVSVSGVHLQEEYIK